MHITIKNVKAVSVVATSQPEHVDVDMNGVALEEILKNVDILAAIQYYGMAELLDSIGEEQLKSYLDCL